MKTKKAARRVRVERLELDAETAARARDVIGLAKLQGLAAAAAVFPAFFAANDGAGISHDARIKDAARDSVRAVVELVEGIEAEWARRRQP